MIKELLTKRPFVRVTPLDYNAEPVLTNAFTDIPASESATFEVVTQSTFVREFYPSGHKINSPVYYPDKIKYDEKTKRYFEQKVVRVTAPFQFIITVQQLIHLCGNDIHFELTGEKKNEEKDDLLRRFQKGWLDKNMEIVFYDFAKSVKVTGDAACVFYMRSGKVCVKNLSFLNGDRLYPHFDSVTGELTVFARQYDAYDENGDAVVSWVEVWDSEYMYRYRKNVTGAQSVVNKVKEFFGIDGYSLAEKPVPHNFKRCPVVYYRDDNGPCWTFSQDNIDKYELSLSHLCQNNMAYAFPIMVLKGDNVDIQGDIYGDVKAITMDPEGDASYLQTPHASESFKLQLETLLKLIFMGSFIVSPPEVRSGDMPGVAIKLIYSPSLEKAIIDAKNFDKPLDEIVALFKYGYSIESGSKLNGLDIFAWIEPYVHQNTAELIANLVSAVQTGILSVETASELTTLGKNDEISRIKSEKLLEEQAERLAETPIAETDDGN